MLKKFINGMCSFLLLGLLASQSLKSSASSAPVLPYTAFIVPVTLGTLCVASFGWSWWTGEKVSRIDKNLELVAVDVKDVQAKLKIVDERVQDVQRVQGEHTQGLQGLASGQGLIRNDISALKSMTETGIRKLTDSQDLMRGSLEKRLDKQARELAAIKALLTNSNSNCGTRQAVQAEGGKKSGVCSGNLPAYKPLFTTVETN